MKQHRMSVYTTYINNPEKITEVTAGVCITSKWRQVMTTVEVTYNWHIIKTMEIINSTDCACFIHFYVF
jgi:hypothetical protein